MSDFDDDIGDMTTDLLAIAGESFVYRRGSSSTTVTLAKSAGSPMVMTAADGNEIEVRPVDFKGLTSALPYAVPLQGDRISGGGKIYEVNPSAGDKVFQILSPQMIRIHTKLVGPI